MLYAKFGLNRPSGSKEEHFKISSNVFPLFRYHLPLEKGGDLHLYKVSFTQGCFVLSLIEIGPLVLEKKIFKIRLCIFLIT